MFLSPTLFRRAMSTAPKKLHDFLVFAPDKTAEGTLELRYEVRPTHLKNIKPAIDSNIVRVAGMYVTPDTIEEGYSGVNKSLGSLLIIQAESLEKAREMMLNDVYYTSGVWDPEKLQIHPFIPAKPLP